MAEALLMANRRAFPVIALTALTPYLTSVVVPQQGDDASEISSFGISPTPL